MQEPHREERAKFPTILIAIVAVAVAVVAILSLVFWYLSSRYGYGYPYGYGMMGWFGFPMMLVMFPIMLVVLFVIGYVIYRSFRWGSGCCVGRRYRYYSTTYRETALEVLRRRYANGEITKEQFEQMKKDLLA